MKKLAILLLSCLITSTAWCVCQVPQPRLICAEYTQSNAVVIAKLVGAASDSKEFPSYHVYKLDVIRRLRGEVPKTFEVFEGNDSGRAPFDWNLNQEYLLFLEKGARWSHYDDVIDGCGNSAPLADAGPVLKKIYEVSSERDSGTISGMVGTDSWTTGVPGAIIKISGGDYDSETQTNAKGRFSQKVPAGKYIVTAAKDGIPIPAGPFSYENPAHAVIVPGGCAQVQFKDSKR